MKKRVFSKFMETCQYKLKFTSKCSYPNEKEDLPYCSVECYNTCPLLKERLEELKRRGEEIKQQKQEEKDRKGSFLFNPR